MNVLELRSVRGTGGGPEKTILYGAARADTTRVSVTVCYVRDARDAVFSVDDWAKALGVNYVEVPERRSVDLHVLGRLTRVVQQHRIDIVHAHDYKTDFLAWWLARRSGVLPMATAHGWTGHSLRERLLYYPVDRWILARLPQTIAVSSDIRQQLVRAGAKPNRVSVILNAIDPQAFVRRPERAVAVRTALGVADGEFLVGAVGRLERQKRFDFLLDALPPLLRVHRAVRLAIVGDGSLMTSLRTQARAAGIADRVIFTGHRTDIADLHNGFDLFVQSSEYEGTPNAVLEAMAMETPLVATDAGGTAELFTPDVQGLLVPIRDVQALTRAMEQAIAAPHRSRERAAAARHRVETDLSFEARTRRLESIYLALAEARIKTPRQV